MSVEPLDLQIGTVSYAVDDLMYGYERLATNLPGNIYIYIYI